MPYNYYWLFFCQLSSAIGQPFLLNAFVPFSSRFYQERRALMLSILSLSMYLGTIFALATGYSLYLSSGLNGLILPTAVISVAGMLVFILGSLKFEEKRVESGFTFRLREVSKRKDLWLIGCILGLGVAAFDNMATWLQPALETVKLGKIAGDAVALAIIFGLIGITFVPNFISKLNLRTAYIRSIIPLIALFFFVLSAHQDEILVYALLATSGFLMLPAYPIIMDWIGKFHEKEIQGSATGFVGLVSRAISVAMMFSAPYFIHSAGVYFSFLTAIVATAFIFALFVPNDRKMSLPNAFNQQ